MRHIRLFPAVLLLFPPGQEGAFPLCLVPFLIPIFRLKTSHFSSSSSIKPLLGPAGADICYLRSRRMQVQKYPLAVHSWRSTTEPILIRCRPSSELIASFPLEFVQRGGNDSWQYVLDVVTQLVEPNPGHEAQITDSEGNLVVLGQKVRSGVLWYEHRGM